MRLGVGHPFGRIGRQGTGGFQRLDALEPVVQVWNLSLRPLLEQYLAGLDATARNAELERLSKVLLKPTVAE